MRSDLNWIALNPFSWYKEDAGETEGAGTLLPSTGVNEVSLFKFKLEVEKNDGLGPNKVLRE